MAGQEEYAVGQAVEGHYRNGRWYSAKINSMQEDGVYLLDWDDCDTQDRRKSAIRLRKGSPGAGDVAVRHPANTRIT
jgi:hypothetical protein